VQITEVRIKLMDDVDDRLQGFCSITLDDCFVIRDLKIIDGTSGPFVAMPSRKLTAHCLGCGCKNHLRAAYCNQCGQKLQQEFAGRDQDGRAKLYADIAHPINSKCREMIQNRVITEFQAEVDRSKKPGYVSRYDEVYDYENPPGADQPRRDETSRVQPAEPHPNPPHAKPAEESQRKTSDAGGFGAGVFDS
jgi:stage V sporulation protein G